MQGGRCSRAAATQRIIGGLVALALTLGLGACGGADDEQQPASTTSTKAERAPTTPVLPKKAGPPKVPEQVAGDVTAVREALEGAGFTVEHSEGSLFLWVTRGENGRDTIDWLAERGVLAAPGDFYGAAGARHVRVAFTATDERIAAAVDRLTSA